jgi:exodeoxyribonuclease VII small subunit
MADALPDKKEASPDVSAMSFEQALEELEAIVRQLEGGKGRLDDAISSYERGAALKRHCESKLAEARAKIERISLSADGTPRADASPQD